MINKNIFFILFFGAINLIFAQSKSNVSKLFQSEEPIEIKMSYSNKGLKKETNDSTYVSTSLSYKVGDNWQELPVLLRGRGNFRKKKCYFLPIKIKAKKAATKGTVFEGNKKMKLVLPCKLESNNNDNIIQEYMAYKMFSVISPYYFNTRRVRVDLFEEKKKKTREFLLEGFLIEDYDLAAKRLGGNEVKAVIHPLAIDTENEMHNAFFQFMIGNTDFSMAYQHNGKLLYGGEKIVHLPYDFDMSGLVNASYSVVNPDIGINRVTERKYRGFERSDSLFQVVRKHFLDKKPKIIGIVEELESEFDNVKEYNETKAFIEDFYEIIEDDKLFKEKIIKGARVK